jgi:hypothetical protein
MNKRLGIFCAISLAVSGTVIAGGKKNEPGLPLTLPKTLLSIDLTVTKTVQYSGAFCTYADLFEQESISSDFVGKCHDQPKSETGIDAFSATPTGVPDPALNFLIPPNRRGGWGIDASTALDFTERGILNSVEDERTSRRFELVSSIIGSGLGLVPKFGLSDGINKIPPPPPNDVGKFDDSRFRKEVLTDWRLVWNYERLSTERKKMFVDLFTNKDFKFAAARNAYAEIEALRKRYQSLLDGQGGAGSATLLPQVQNELESALKRYFLGFSKSVSWAPTFEVDPQEGEVPLVLLSDCGAKLPSKTNARLSKNPITPDISCDDAAIPVSLRMTKETMSLPDLPAIATCLDKDSKLLKGIPFAVPADVRLALTNASDMPEQLVQVAQMGKQSCIPLPGGSYTAAVTYWASTGAVKSVKFTNKSSLSKDSVSALGSMASDFQKAIADSKQKAEDAAANKDLDALKSQRERLEERVKIQAACSTLNITCDF